MRSPASSDPFGTERMRAAVLAAWTASPARFREDANAEEELSRGAYRDRVIVELAQNAADAAVEAGAPGRLLLRLEGSTLVAANTGAPLDAAGVEGLSTLRASTKRDGAAVGRFGVGFAAVLAVTDEPAVLSTSGAVRWSRAEAANAAAAVPELAAELARRGAAVPVLRLPMPADGGPLEGYDTAVRIPLRDDKALELVRSLLRGVDDALLLSLPGLAEVLIEIDGAGRSLAVGRSGSDVWVTEGDRKTRWRLAERTGRVPDQLMAERPAEEPDRYRATVAVPVSADEHPLALPQSMPSVVHAPTPTDEPTGLPVLVLAGFPLDSSRRRVVPGPLTDLLAGEVAAAYAEQVVDLAAAGPAVLDLVPGPLPAGELDATLHRAIVPALAGATFVPAAGADGSPPLAPRDVVLVDGLRSAAEPAKLARFVPGLPDLDWWRIEPLRQLGAQVVQLGEVIDSLADVRLATAGWRELYAALDGADLESLATLPVPLADGRLVRGARGVLLPTNAADPETLAPLGLRVAAAEAVHPLLTRLGATDANAATVLRDPAVRVAVEAEDEAVAESVLRLVGASGLTTANEPWLAGTLVPDAAGELAPAGQLWFPGSDVLDLLDVDLAEFTADPAAVERWGRDVLAGVGVRQGFGVIRERDVPLDGDLWHGLDDEAGWLAAIRHRLPDDEVATVLVELAAVRDLDLVHEDRWAGALDRLAADPETRRAIIEPALVQLADGSRRRCPPYTAWWLREHGRLGGVPVGRLCADDADPLVKRLLPAVPTRLDAAVSAALGLARTVTDLADEPQLLLDRLADSSVRLPAADLAQIYAALAAADLAVDSVPVPDRVRVPDGVWTRVVPAGSVVVADGPQWLQLVELNVIAGDDQLAALLDLPLAGERADPYPTSPGAVAPVPAAMRRLLPDARDTYVEHDELIVAGVSVDWWVDPDGTIHAATADGLARGLAWAAKRWALRLELAEALRDPEVVPVLLAERAFRPVVEQ